MNKSSSWPADPCHETVSSNMTEGYTISEPDFAIGKTDFEYWGRLWKACASDPEIDDEDSGTLKIKPRSSVTRAHRAESVRVDNNMTLHLRHLILDLPLHSRSSLDALRIQPCTEEADMCFRDWRGIYLTLLTKSNYEH